MTFEEEIIIKLEKVEKELKGNSYGSFKEFLDALNSAWNPRLLIREKRRRSSERQIEIEEIEKMTNEEEVIAPMTPQERGFYDELGDLKPKPREGFPIPEMSTDYNGLLPPGISENPELKDILSRTLTNPYSEIEEAAAIKTTELIKIAYKSNWEK